MGKRVLDMRGRSCPTPIIELMRTMRVMGDGETVEVLADDRAFPADVLAWCKKTQNALVSMSSEAETHTAVVRKGPVEA